MALGCLAGNQKSVHPVPIQNQNNSIQHATEWAVQEIQSHVSCQVQIIVTAEGKRNW